MRQTFRYKVCVSRDFPLSLDLKPREKISLNMPEQSLKHKYKLEQTFLYLLFYSLSMPSSSGVEIPSSSNVGLSSWITYG